MRTASRRCVVRDTATEHGAPVEITDDWYAQDAAGNVWYLGEYTAEYENGQVGRAVPGRSRPASAAPRPGIAMPADPEPGHDLPPGVLLQGEAEDQGAVVTVGQEHVEVPFGFFDKDVLMTRDPVPTEPRVEELKFYAPGVGPLLTHAHRRDRGPSHPGPLRVGQVGRESGAGTRPASLSSNCHPRRVELAHATCPDHRSSHRCHGRRLRRRRDDDRRGSGIGEPAALPQGGEHVELDRADFTTEITNPYWPMAPGDRWVYSETDGRGGEMKVVVEVLAKTKRIANGIEARVVRDTVDRPRGPG